MEPASIRFKNPGAMWGNPIAKRWGSKQTVVLHDGLGQGNNIAVFDTFVDGICAQLDLWRTSPHYKNQRLDAALRVWSGGNNVPSYIAYVKQRCLGISESTIMDDTFWRGPMGVAFLKAQAGHEAGKPYPAAESDWIEAQKRVFGTSSKQVAKKTATAAATTGTIAATAQVAHNSGVPLWVVVLIVVGAVAAVVGVWWLMKKKKTADDEAFALELAAAAKEGEHA